MGEQTEQINIIKLLMDIKADVSSIKTDMNNFKEAQKVEKENTVKDISDVRSACERDFGNLAGNHRRLPNQERSSSQGYGPDG